MVSKYGFFLEVAYIPSTAALVKRKGVRKQAQDNASRTFRPICGHHTGKGHDAVFSLFDYIITGDSSKRQGKSARQNRKADGHEHDRARPFRPASPMKRATAPQAGEVHGTISGRDEHIPDASQKRLLKGNVPTQPKNFVTRHSPAATIGQVKDAKGVAGEYAYHADPYSPGQHRSAGKAPKASHSKHPFKASCGGRLGGAFGKIQYEALGPSKARGPKQPNLRPFKPGHAGRGSAFSAQPEYMACPAHKASSAQAGRGKINKHLLIWRPTHGSLTTATPLSS